MTDPLAVLAASLAAPGQPQTLFAALERETAALVGHKLFTLLFVDGADVARIYSNRPAEYPVSGRKTMAPRPGASMFWRSSGPISAGPRGDPLGLLRPRTDRQHGPRLGHQRAGDL